jgi:hypothetical protein
MFSYENTFIGDIFIKFLNNSKNKRDALLSPENHFDLYQ